MAIKLKLLRGGEPDPRLVEDIKFMSTLPLETLQSISENLADTIDPSEPLSELNPELNLTGHDVLRTRSVLTVLFEAVDSEYSIKNIVDDLTTLELSKDYISKIETLIDELQKSGKFSNFEKKSAIGSAFFTVLPTVTAIEYNINNRALKKMIKI